MNIPKTDKKRIVVIGGGFGGTRMIHKLKNTDYQVVLLDKQNYHTFQPLLYQVATAGLEPGSIAYPLRKMFIKHPNFIFRVADVMHVNHKEKVIETNIGELSYDYLVIATGAITNFFDIEGLDKVAMPMKTVNEALDIRSMLLQLFERAILVRDDENRRKLMNFVIVGGGPTGVELAGALCELKTHVLPKDYPDLDLNLMEVRLIEAGPRVLSGMSDYSSRKAKKYLEKMGVKVQLNTMVKSYDGKTVETNKETFKAGKVIWAAGVKGNPIKGLSEAMHVSGRLRVTPYLQVEGYDDVFAVGDVALLKSEKYPKGHPQVAPVAIQQGEYLANNFKRLSDNKQISAFKYTDKGSMASVGKNKAVVDFFQLKFGGFLGWLVWMFVHLMSLVGFRNRVVTLMNWSWNYVNYEHGVRLITRPMDLDKRFN